MMNRFQPLLFSFSLRRYKAVTQNVTKLYNRFSGYPAPRDWPLYLAGAYTRPLIGSM